MLTLVYFHTQGVPEGKGKFVTKLGRGELVYEGELMQGEPDGQGREVLPNGDEYEVYESERECVREGERATERRVSCL
jgi:hypothetical protein